MRTIVPPQFTGEDLQQLLAAALTAPPAPSQPPRPVPEVPAGRPVAGTAGGGDAWDERW